MAHCACHVFERPILFLRSLHPHPQCLALHLRGLRRLHLDGLISAPSDDSLGELTTLTSLQLAGFGNELDEAPYGPTMDLPDSLAVLRLLRNVSIHGSDRSSAPMPFTPLCEWMLLGNAEVLGELPALANAEFVGVVAHDLDWLQASPACPRAAPLLGSQPGLPQEAPPHQEACKGRVTVQPLPPSAHVAMRRQHSHRSRFPARFPAPFRPCAA